jgi:hypothetical protein
MHRSVASLALATALVAASAACDRSTTLSPGIQPEPAAPVTDIVQSTTIAAYFDAQAGPVIKSTTFEFPDPAVALEDMVILYDSAQADGPVVLEVVSNVTAGDILNVNELMGGGGLLYWREGDQATDVYARMIAVDFAIIRGSQVSIQRFFVPMGDSLRFLDTEAANHKLAVYFTAWEAFPVNAASIVSGAAGTGPIRLISPSQPERSTMAAFSGDCGYNRPPGSCGGGVSQSLSGPLEL